ncbi:kelch-like protein 10 [Dinothrombium tinctorium]|uniref:Kelch-like protein diablo n=1 Tax=Dinothrombium tinctorium TaxID=1965070 RepID=A0A3S3Q6C7_9ACAR|nr:kelch-like protein 10 [Dinothrombium tinctorium]
MPLPLVFKANKYVHADPDLCLIANDGEKQHLVHKVVLMSIVPYFETIFEYSRFPKIVVEHKGKKLTVDLLILRNISRDILSGIIAFAYSGKITITSSNVEELMMASDMYNITELLQKCIAFCESLIDPTNCVGIYIFSDRINCNQLMITSKNYILNNFQELCERSQEFFDLTSKHFMQNLLEDNMLHVSDELVVWRSLVKWVRHRERDRLNDFHLLCQSVRFGVISQRDLQTDVLLHPYVQQCEKTKSLVSELISITKMLESSEKIDSNIVQNPVYMKYLTPRYPKDIILVFGGRTLELEFVNPETMIEAYDCKIERWKTVNISDPQGPRDHNQVAVAENCVYIIGGHQGPFNVLNSCRKFDLRTKKWSEIAPMQERRAFLACVVMSKYIYAIGGYNGNWRVKSVERYDVYLNQWTPVKDMHERRSGTGAAILDGRIYVVGGFRDMCYLNSAEYYSPDHNEWTLITPMIKPRSSPCTVAYNNQIYVIGGLCANGLIACGERYDPQFETWIPLEDDMMEKKCSASAVVLGDKIYVIGGWNGVGGLRSVEIWSDETKKWVLGTKLQKRRTGCAACVIRDVPKIEDYVYQQREEMVAEAFLRRINNQSSKEKQNASIEEQNTEQIQNNQEANFHEAVGFINDNRQNFNQADDDWIDID